MSLCRREWCGRGQFRQRIKEHLVTPPRRKCVKPSHQNPALICPCLVCTDCQPLIILRPKGYTHSRMFSFLKIRNSSTSWFGNGGYLSRVKGKVRDTLLFFLKTITWWNLLLVSLLYLFYLIFWNCNFIFKKVMHLSTYFTFFFFFHLTFWVYIFFKVNQIIGEDWVNKGDDH